MDVNKDSTQDIDSEEEIKQLSAIVQSLDEKIADYESQAISDLETKAIAEGWKMLSDLPIEAFNRVLRYFADRRLNQLSERLGDVDWCIKDANGKLKSSNN